MATFEILAASSGSSSVVGYPEGTKMYVALLSQSGTNAPVATVLVNTLGGTVVWTRDDVGLYSATLSGVFTSGKTVCFATCGTNDGGAPATTVLQMARTSNDVVYLYSYMVDTGSVIYNDITAGSPVSVQILVFPS